MYRSEQNAAEYLKDTYGEGARDYGDEYELRAALRDAEANPTPIQARRRDEDREASGEEWSVSMAALSVDKRVAVDNSSNTAPQYIRDNYNVDPSEYSDADVLRAALEEQR